MFITEEQNIKNRKELQNELRNFVTNGLRTTKDLHDSIHYVEIMRSVLKSKLPNEKKNLVNTGTSTFPNYYKSKDTPIWIIGFLGSVWYDLKTDDGIKYRIHFLQKEGERPIFHITREYDSDEEYYNEQQQNYLKSINVRTPLQSSKTQGRNEKCNCGSGKKYKKCCMRKQIINI